MMIIEYESESFHDLWVVSFFCLSEYIQVQVQYIDFHFRSFQKLKFSCSSSLTSLSDPELIVHFFQSGTRFNMLLKSTSVSILSQ